MEGYSTILFDWDGCLADTLELWVDVCGAALANQGIRAPKAEIKKHYARGGVTRMFDIRNTEIWDKDVREIASAHIKNVALYEGAKELLEVLSKTKQLAIVTDAHREVLIQNLEHHDLAKYFQTIITRDDLKYLKPHPEGIKKAMAVLRAEPRKTIMIGDSDKDIRAARNAGVDSILIHPRSHDAFYDLKELLRHEPTHVMSNLRVLEQQFIL